jgi:selenoprotein W-related protein
MSAPACAFARARVEWYHRAMIDKPRITILYCTQCNWLLRAGWMAQELLQTFGQSLGEVALIPGTGGNFEIRVNDELVWERKRDGGFPGPKELKQRIRDIIEPERDLGHVDRADQS